MGIDLSFSIRKDMIRNWDKNYALAPNHAYPIQIPGPNPTP